ncbi:helicase [Jeotgalibacillus malaysiensis]|uniref:helicase n=1 Tax=Jeotgalibacillus malaysiensis TaxID=1508404 RepID=UPI00384C5434
MTKTAYGTYPDCPFIKRAVAVGGMTKSECIQKLNASSIRLNEYAEKLLFDEKFLISEAEYSLDTVELTVQSLGFLEGANTSDLFKGAGKLGLNLCPVELGPFLRLAYTDQTEQVSNVQNQAPSGAATIASEPLYDHDDFPKGFYLRRIDGELWLRGYTADHLHVWNPEDVFIFCLKSV